MQAEAHNSSKISQYIRKADNSIYMEYVHAVRLTQNTKLVKLLTKVFELWNV